MSVARAIAPTLGCKRALVSKDLSPKDLACLCKDSANAAQVRTVLTRRKLENKGSMAKRLESIFDNELNEINDAG